MKFIQYALNKYFRNNIYYIQATCEQLNVSIEELNQLITDYCLNNPQQWIKSIKTIDFDLVLPYFDKEKLKQFLDMHQVDAQISFFYYMKIYVYVYNNNLDDLVKIALNKKINKKKNVCVLGMVVDDDRWFDVVYDTLNIKQVNRIKLQLVNKDYIKQVLIQNQPTTEIEFCNLLYRDGIPIELEFDFKKLPKSNHFMEYLFNRMFKEQDYDYDLQTLKLTERYIINQMQENCFFDSYYRYLLIAFIHLVLIKYKNSVEMIKTIKSLQMSFALMNKYLTDDLFTNVTNDEERLIYRTKLSMPEYKQYWWYVVLYNDGSYKRYIVRFDKHSHICRIEHMIYDSLYQTEDYKTKALQSDYKDKGIKNTYEYRSDGWKFDNAEGKQKLLNLNKEWFFKEVK